MSDSLIYPFIYYYNMSIILAHNRLDCYWNSSFADNLRQLYQMLNIVGIKFIHAFLNIFLISWKIFESNKQKLHGSKLLQTFIKI